MRRTINLHASHRIIYFIIFVRVVFAKKNERSAARVHLCKYLDGFDCTYCIKQIDDFRDVIQISDEDHFLHWIRCDCWIGGGTRQLHRSRPIWMVSTLLLCAKCISHECDNAPKYESVASGSVNKNHGVRKETKRKTKLYGVRAADMRYVQYIVCLCNSN